MRNFMEKSTVYFTDFRCKVGTSQLDKLKNCVLQPESKTLIWMVNSWPSKCISENLEILLSCAPIMQK